MQLSKSLPLRICKRVVNSLFKCFSWVVDPFDKGLYAVSFVEMTISTSFCKAPGEHFNFKLKIYRAADKFITHQRLL
jgi:hypothetical protein